HRIRRRAWREVRTRALVLTRRGRTLEADAPPRDVIEPELHRARSRLERILHENIAPFWLPRVLDEQGGYRLHHGPDGKWLGPAPRQVVTQARMLWYFASMARDDAAAPASAQHLDAAAYLEAARHGYTFLWEVMWDQQHGGFTWEVGPDGRPLRENK